MDKVAPRLALLACSVFEREIAQHTPDDSNIVETKWFEMGLHDQPDNLRTTLQGAIDELDQLDDIDAIVLAYGLCGLGTAGLRAGRHRLVIPRGHDCITVFLGNKERYAAHQGGCPSCYYYSPGWNRNRRVPGPEKLDAMRAELLEKYDEEDVDFLIDSERETWALHDTVSYVDLGTSDAEPEADYARRCAKWLGWKFERLQGDASMLIDLLAGRWNADRFQVIEPGEELAHLANEQIMEAKKSQD